MNAEHGISNIEVVQLFGIVNYFYIRYSLFDIRYYFVPIYHIDAHRNFHIDYIGLFTSQALRSLCENPIVAYWVNNYKF